jgi:cobalt-zinc-cadmium efflux system outer membrane protein
MSTAFFFRRRIVAALSLATAILWLSAAAQAEGPEPGTIEEFSTLAIENHPQLRAARAAVEAARGQAVQVRLYPNPMLAGSSPQMAGTDSQWNGYVTQDIVTAGKLRLSQQAALRGVQQAEYELVRARYDVLTGVRSSFYRLLVSQRRLEIFKLLFDIASRSYEIGRQLAAAGEETRADTLFWSIERDRAEVRLINSTVMIETGRRELAAALGLPRADIGMLEGDLFLKLPNFDLKQLQDAVLAANSNPRAAEAAIARAQWSLERAVVQPIPNINLMGGYQRQVGPPQDQGLMQVMCEVPIFNRNQGNIRSARADIASARADLRRIEIELAAQTAEAVNRYRQARRQAEWYEDLILPKARETVRVTQLLYAQGELTFLRLLQAQQILTETELAYVESQEARWQGAVAIADLLQLEEFPPTASAPAAIDLEAGEIKPWAERVAAPEFLPDAPPANPLPAPGNRR